MDPEAEELVATSAEPLHFAQLSAPEACLSNGAGAHKAKGVCGEERLEKSCRRLETNRVRGELGVNGRYLPTMVILSRAGHRPPGDWHPPMDGTVA